ncbi:adenosylcobinamide-GDP ribazoletransferase [Dyadobacter psychrotolerans]|uniref:Adenosylcobinamide-GDP ribazoletransferase n=1 Tax=Dyadobacter psychrotolerans TaxID=2541721 RepID=A0A4V2Z4F4_9BACT|nr:adenosylcobinamide-GDP ribazoletransferase [Dyadobacter psychrotolerans]TDE16488.1 adenosylcobinamide-GDP ribazoletransferase [Dyadobacter psychrotolerans]
MIKQLTLFFTALQFYTRFPVPKWVLYHPQNLSRATRYLPLVGWIVGFITALAWLGLTYLTNTSTGLLFGMTASVLTTGAFHEDGFADVCDGFGGGWTKEKILEIMKDSRVGTYGSVGLILILALKFSLLLQLAVLINTDFTILFLILVTAHAVSRFMPVLVIFNQPYARETQDSKAKPVAETADVKTLVMAGTFGIPPMLALSCYVKQPLILLSIGLLVLVTFFLGRYFKKWIGGYTGDCLGAVQQVCEVVFYFYIAVLWKFI